MQMLQIKHGIHVAALTAAALALCYRKETYRSGQTWKERRASVNGCCGFFIPARRNGMIIWISAV